MNIPEVRPVPSFFKRFKRLVVDSKKLTIANFTDVFADVYESRPVFFLDRRLSFSTLSSDTVTYRDLSRITSQIGNGLIRLGVKPGDRVGLMTKNRVEQAFSEFAIWKIGALPVPPNFMLKGDEINYQMENSGARVMITDHEVFAENIKEPSRVPCIKHWVVISEGKKIKDVITLEELADACEGKLTPYEPKSEGEAAIIFYTSGTTGTPKGAVLTHRSMLFTLRNYAKLLALLPTNKKQLALLIMPVAHTSGHQNLLILLAMAIPMIFLSKFDPDQIGSMIERHRVTFFAGIPTMFKMMLAAGIEKYDLSSMKVWGGGADTFTYELVSAFRKWGGWKIGPFRISPIFARGYGMAETAGHVCITPPWPIKGACAGWVVPGIRWKLVDEAGKDVNTKDGFGELVLKGPTIMEGYYNDPEKTEASFINGWFRTGDIMTPGRWGMLNFLEREKDVIKCGGYSIFPSEVEHHLLHFPGIERVVVIGISDEIKGQIPVAVVVPRPGQKVSEEAFLEWAKEKIAAYKCPRKVILTDEIPMTFSFKANRAELTKKYENDYRVNR
jgi:long-chain acyl-CoA synthetase